MDKTSIQRIKRAGGGRVTNLGPILATGVAGLSTKLIGNALFGRKNKNATEVKDEDLD